MAPDFYFEALPGGFYKIVLIFFFFIFNRSPWSPGQFLIPRGGTIPWGVGWGWRPRPTIIDVPGGSVVGPMRRPSGGTGPMGGAIPEWEQATNGRAVGQSVGRTVGRPVSWSAGRTDGRAIRAVGLSGGRPVRLVGRTVGRAVGRTVVKLVDL